MCGRVSACGMRYSRTRVGAWPQARATGPTVKASRQHETTASAYVNPSQTYPHAPVHTTTHALVHARTRPHNNAPLCRSVAARSGRCPCSRPPAAGCATARRSSAGSAMCPPTPVSALPPVCLRSRRSAHTASGRVRIRVWRRAQGSCLDVRVRCARMVRVAMCIMQRAVWGDTASGLKAYIWQAKTFG